MKRISELDGFRVFCIGIVAAFHLWQQSWFTPRVFGVSLDPVLRAGYLPVDGTILLTGFLLCLPFSRKFFHPEEAIPAPAEFYNRRLHRILPHFNLALILTLLCFTLPFGTYPSGWHALLDILSHFSFVFTFSPQTYFSGQIPTTAWTIVIEMQFYLLFPFIGRMFIKKPAATVSLMTAVAFLYRLVFIKTRSDMSMVVNQLPAFLDVYALGMLASLIYVKIADSTRDTFHRQIVSTISLAAALVALWHLFRFQAYNPPTGILQAGQMVVRFPLALVNFVIVLSLPFAVKPVRKIMGNRVMRFLSEVSIDFYLVHQLAALVVKRLDFIPHMTENPAQAAELSWQLKYLAVSVAAGFVLACAMHFAIEYFGKKRCTHGIQRTHERLQG